MGKPKWSDLHSVDVSQCRITKRRKNIPNSSRVIAEKPSAWTHYYTEGEDGPVKAFARRFTAADGTESVHMSYYTNNRVGVPAYGQYGPWLPVKGLGVFVGSMIDQAVVDMADVIEGLRPETRVKLSQMLPPQG
jgi:hypothetical protein